MGSVEVEIAVHVGCDAHTVAVYWLNNDQEVWYHDVPRGGRIRQSTFAGHTWLMRDKTSGVELDRYVATGAAHQVRIIGAPPGALDAAPEGASEANGTDAGRLSASLGRAEWTTADGAFRFVREGAGEGPLWRELDSAGVESTVLVQVRAECGTSWLWWLNLVWTHFHRLDANQQAVLGSLAFVASAQQHSLPSVPWPAVWLNLARAARLPPATLLVLGVFALGIVVAATVPLTHRSVLLKDQQSGRMLKLGDASAHIKGEHANATWRELARGSWSGVPDELRMRGAHRLGHAIAVAAVAVLVAGLYSRHAELNTRGTSI